MKTPSKLCIGAGSRRSAPAEPRLGGGQSSDRNHEGRARHVGHPDLMTELHRRGLAAVLAADPDLQIRPRAPTAFDAEADQLADPFLVENRERVVRQQVLLEVI